MLLNKRATVDLTPHKYSCNRWIDHSNSKAKIISIHNETESECNNVSCYPETDDFYIDESFDVNEINNSFEAPLSNKKCILLFYFFMLRW